MKNILLLFFLAFFVFNSNAQASFSLNDKTTFINVYKDTISFEEFIEYTNKYSYNLSPQFDQGGNVIYVKLDLKENNSIFKTIAAVEAPVVKSRESYRDRHSVSVAEASYTTVKELEGQPAPNFTVHNIDNNTFSLTDNNNEVVFLNFWFSKCAPCIEEIPELNQLADEFKKEDVSFLALTVENLAHTQKYMDENDFDFDIIPEAHKIAALYKTVGYPTSVIIDRQGVVQKVYAGKITNMVEVYKKEINKALLKNEEDASIELLEGESFFYSDAPVFDKNGIVIDEDEFYDIILNYKCYIYKHIKKDKTIYFTILKQKPK